MLDLVVGVERVPKRTQLSELADHDAAAVADAHLQPAGSATAVRDPEDNFVLGHIWLEFQRSVGGFVNRVLAAAVSKYEYIVPRPAEQGVIAGPAIQSVVAIGTGQLIIAIATDKRVVAKVGVDRVVASAADCNIVARIAQQHVVVVSAGESERLQRRWVPLASVRENDLIDDRIPPRIVVPAADSDRVCCAFDRQQQATRIGTLVPDGNVIWRDASAKDDAVHAQGGPLRVVGNRVPPSPSTKEKRVVSLAARQVVVARTAVQVVVAVAAIQTVITRLSEQLIGTRATVQGVILPPAVEHVVAVAATQGIRPSAAVQGVVAFVPVEFVVAAETGNEIRTRVATDGVVIVTGRTPAAASNFDCVPGCPVRELNPIAIPAKRRIVKVGRNGQLIGRSGNTKNQVGRVVAA